MTLMQTIPTNWITDLTSQSINYCSGCAIL